MTPPSSGRSRRLETYRAKRDFRRTAEPAGRPSPGGEESEETAAPQADGEGVGPRPGLFVVQRHRARRLHYDVRLEVDGVLASWAVPKGPTLDPKARHLAVHVEDHPIEYADFEGVIPAGEYGGGDVIVWDRGTWTPAEGIDDPAAAIEAGDLHFDVQSEKLAGRFVLVRRGRDRDRSGREQWLLLHKNDEHARPGWDPEDHPHSVKSGRTNEEVAAAPEAMWKSDLPADQAEVRLPVQGDDGEQAPGGRDAGATRARGASRRRRGSSGDGGSPRERAPGGRGRSGRRASPPAEERAWEPAAVEPPTADELAALDALEAEGPWEFQGRRLRLTNLDKVLFPGRDGEEPVTKRDLVRYHAQMAPAMLPYLARRPLNMHRFPGGIDKPGFWHKEIPDHAPEWLPRWHNDEADPGETEWYIVADDPPVLAWLANFGAVELHAWTSRIPRVHEPTWVLFDIDPGPETSFEDVLVLARLHRTALEHLGVEGRPKVSGQRGIQIWVPVAPGYTFAETRGWAETVSRAVGATMPDLVSWAWTKRDRRGLARLDYTQNAINKTLVAPYSARPRPGAPVSVPIAWDELDDPGLRPDGWTIRTVVDRVPRSGDPMAPLVGMEQELPSL